jgi:hypothetical protein
MPLLRLVFPATRAADDAADMTTYLDDAMVAKAA